VASEVAVAIGPWAAAEYAGCSRKQALAAAAVEGRAKSNAASHMGTERDSAHERCQLPLSFVFGESQGRYWALGSAHGA
jgi:hypothetical protein